MSFDKEMNDSQGYKPLLEYYTDLSRNQIVQSQYDTNFILKYIICDNQNSNSVKNLVVKARENAGLPEQNNERTLGTHQLDVPFHECTRFVQKIGNLRGPKRCYRTQRRPFVVQRHSPRDDAQGMSWCFSNIGKQIERCLQTISMTQAYFKPIYYNLDGEEDLLYWRRLLLSLSGYEQYLKSYSNIPHNRKVVQHVIFNRDFSHSVIYTLELLDKYLDSLIMDNNSSEARTLQNQFGRLKSLIELPIITT